MLKNVKNQIIELLNTIEEAIYYMKNEKNIELKNDIFFSISFIQKIFIGNEINDLYLMELRKLIEDIKVENNNFVIDDEKIFNILSNIRNMIEKLPTKLKILFIVNSIYDLLYIRDLYNYVNLLDETVVHMLVLPYLLDNVELYDGLEYQKNYKIYDYSKYDFEYEQPNIIYICNNYSKEYLEKLQNSCEQLVCLVKPNQEKKIFDSIDYIDKLVVFSDNSKFLNNKKIFKADIIKNNNDNRCILVDTDKKLISEDLIDEVLKLSKIFDIPVIIRKINDFDLFYDSLNKKIENNYDKVKIEENICEYISLNNLIIHSEDNQNSDLRENSFILTNAFVKKDNVINKKNIKKRVSKFLEEVIYDNNFAERLYEKNKNFVMMSENFNKAMSNIEIDYKYSIKLLIKVYNASEYDEDKEYIFDIIKKYNLTENFEKCYNHNIEFLKKYRFIFGYDELNLNDLKYSVMYFDDGIYYIYDKLNKKFLSECNLNIQDIGYIFEHLEDNILFCENEYNFKNLEYLETKFRRSEDYGSDNHIYIYYDDKELFFVHMAIYSEFYSLLIREKFVILLGKENKLKYPIDFKKEYNIDYKNNKYVPIGIDEIQDMCFFYMRTRSGTVFATSIISANDNVFLFGSSTFYRYSIIKGKKISEGDYFKNVLNDFDRKYTLDELKGYPQRSDYIIEYPQYNKMIEYIDNNSDKVEYNILELFKYYIAFELNTYLEKNNKNPRIVPKILFEPHFYESYYYEKILLDFKYLKCLSVTRDPIKTLIRCYETKFLHYEWLLRYTIANDYEYMLFESEKFRDNYYGFLFENLKKYPEKQIKNICKVLNIPYQEKMLNASAGLGNEKGEVVKGFDMRAVNVNIEHLVTEFDMLRLKIFYEPILKYYGYDSLEMENFELLTSNVVDLFKYPFKFEQRSKEIYSNFRSSDISNTIHKTLEECYVNYKSGKKIIFPKLIGIEE